MLSPTVQGRDSNAFPKHPGIAGKSWCLRRWDCFLPDLCSYTTKCQQEQREETNKSKEYHEIIGDNLQRWPPLTPSLTVPACCFSHQVVESTSSPHESRLVCDLLWPKECGRRDTVSVWVFKRSWKPEVCHNAKCLVWLSETMMEWGNPSQACHMEGHVERGSLILAEKPRTWAIKPSLIF